MIPTTVAWVSLGANLGRRGRALARLRTELAGDGVLVEAVSRELLTRAVGVRRQPDFVNQVVRLRAAHPLGAEQWLARCDRAQSAAGRRPTYRWGPRRADADILLLGEHGQLRVALPGLRVPHPELGDRPFFCALLAELDPVLRHPDGWLLAGRGGVFTSGGGRPAGEPGAAPPAPAPPSR